MPTLLGFSAAAIFFIAAALHFYWAVTHGAKSSAESKFLPSSGNQSVFRPSRLLTFLVALMFLGCGLLLIGKLGYIGSLIAENVYQIALELLAVLLLLRAVGDFRLIGMFKKNKNTAFARMDTKLYIPLCIGLAVCCTVVAWH